jgi:hypothetical protein
MLIKQSVWETNDVLLYTTSGLDPAIQHHLTIENLIAGKQLVVDYAIITQIQASKTCVMNRVWADMVVHQVHPL